MNYLISIQYDGSNFFGFAKQGKLRTIQGILEEILLIINKCETKVYGSGRTDRYVHALNQYCSFSLKYDIPENKLFNFFKKKLPKDILINSVKKISSKFHPRFCALSKTYMYVIEQGKNNLWNRNYVYQHNKQISINKLYEASKLFLGEKNFLSFSTSTYEINKCLRKVNFIEIKTYETKVFIFINANGFLRNMVRMIIAAMLNYSEDKLSHEQIINFFNNPKKGKSNSVLDGSGLYLYDVYYSKENDPKKFIEKSFLNY